MFALHNLWVEGRDLEQDLDDSRNRSDIWLFEAKTERLNLPISLIHIKNMYATESKKLFKAQFNGLYT